ncbi:Hypothetical protein GSB_155061 [Giardia duodenalis]|uniref:Uncharacterized protein n=1 Tax=Giardia intestinalis TaxID=5741 RepID=V6TSS7_GIAIN|nr:Hypothetical protein GSB_155061 [Giardia intestinalis]
MSALATRHATNIMATAILNRRVSTTSRVLLTTTK